MQKIPEIAKKELTKLLEGNKNFISGKPTAKNMCLKTLQSRSSAHPLPSG